MSLPELAYRGEVKNVLQTLQSDDVWGNRASWKKAQRIVCSVKHIKKSQNFQDHMFCVAAQINSLSLSVVKGELKNEVYAPLKKTHLVQRTTEQKNYN